MNNYLAKVRILIWLCLFAIVVNGQDTLFLNIQPIDKSLDFFTKKVHYQNTFGDTLTLNNELQKVIQDLQTASYLEASIDELQQQGKQYIARLHIGESYKWARLENGNIEPSILESIGWRSKGFENQKIDYRKILELQEQLLSYAENNGYPFAQVWLDDLKISGQELQAKIFMKKNNLIVIDAINIIGEAEVSDNYLLNYLGLKRATPFDKSQILNIDNRLRDVSFIKQTQAPKITFKGDKATVNLFLEKKKASRFDLIFGVLPNSNPVVNKRLLVTGTGTIDLQNAFGLGERVFAEFRQLRPETQEVEVAFLYPYILNIPFGADLKFNLYKRDTAYLDLEYDLGLQYLFEGGNYLKAFWNNRSTNLLTVNDLQIIQSRQLPSRLDVKNTTFGLEYLWQAVDYRFNPRKGWTLFLRGGAGVKEVKKNNTIINLEDTNEPDFDYESLYDELPLESFQYRLETKLETYLPLSARTTLKLAAQNGTILSEATIFQNEAFRIGGNRVLRGFDEEVIFASLYALLTVEYRWLLTQNSNLYLFTDAAYVEDTTQGNRIFQRPLGLGLGITFDTAVGVFGLGAAVGRDLANPADFLDFQSPKIHFGYVNLF